MRPWPLLLACLLLAAPALAQELPPADHPSSPVILVLVYDVTWEDLLVHPTLRGMARQGAVGLLCTRTAGEPNPQSAALTLGAGARVTCDLALEDAGLALCAQEALAGRPAPELYRAMMGREMGKAQVAYLAGPLVAGENAGLGYRVVPGLLGEAIRGAGGATAVLGNADLPAMPPHRYGAAVAMDAGGLVRWGDVGARCLLAAPESPSGVATDYDYLLGQLGKLADGCSLVVIETGDTDRLARLAGQVTAEVAAREKAVALLRLDGFLSQLTPAAAVRGWRVLVVCTGAAGLAAGQRLSPVLWWGPGVRPGLLGSASTRSPWLGTNLDLAPTILRLHRMARPPELLGLPLAVTPAGDPVALVRAVEQRQQRAEQARPLLAKTVTVLLIGLLALGAAALLLPGLGRRWGRLARGGLVYAGWLPLAMLAWPVDSGRSGPVLLAGTLGTALALATASLALHRRLPVWLLLPGAASLVLAVDILVGSPLSAASGLGYSLASGARFYGLGNEYGGVLVGAGIALAGGLAALPKRRVRPLLLLGLVGLVGLAGAGWAGANLGIALAGAVGAVAFAHYTPAPRRLLWGLAALLGVAGLAAAALELLGGQASHIGRAVALVAEGGAPAAAGIIGRKLMMNWTLLRFSDWTYVLLAALAVTAGPALLRPERWRAWSGRQPALQRATKALLVTALAAFLCNDSGVLAAALALVTGGAGIAYSQLEEKEPGPERE